MHLFAKMYLKLDYGRKCHMINSANMVVHNYIVYHSELFCSSKKSQDVSYNDDRLTILFLNSRSYVSNCWAGMVWWCYQKSWRCWQYRSPSINQVTLFSFWSKTYQICMIMDLKAIGAMCCFRNQCWWSAIWKCPTRLERSNTSRKLQEYGNRPLLLWLTRVFLWHQQRDHPTNVSDLYLKVLDSRYIQLIQNQREDSVGVLGLGWFCSIGHSHW